MALDIDSESVSKTIDIQQAVIGRMAQCSSSIKTWCITVVTGIAIYAADKGKWQHVLIGFIPVLLFAALDIYYLAMERCFRGWHSGFVQRLTEGKATEKDLFDVGECELTWKSTFSAATSLSIWPFYVITLFGLLAVGLVAKVSS